VPNIILAQNITNVEFAPAGNNAFGVTSLANTPAGRVSEWADLSMLNGAGSSNPLNPRPTRFGWLARTKVTGGNPVVGEYIEQRIIRAWTHPGATVYADGNQANADAALSSLDKLLNMQQIEPIMIDKADSNEHFTASGIVTLLCDFVGICWVNRTSRTLSATNGDHFFVLFPMPDEIQ